LILAAFVLSVPASLDSLAQQYPTKPVRLIVPFSPGGLSDALSRGLSQRLAESLGQSVLVENRPGASAIIGTEAAAKAAPDGYTLLIATNEGMAINPHVYRKLPYALDDFVPVALIARTVECVLVRSDLPVNNLRELIAYSKAQPGKLNYGTWGAGTLPHLATETFKLKTGADFTHVPFKGAGDAVPALLNGQIQVLFVAQGLALPHIKSGKIKALAVFSDKRQPALGDVPTMAEAGFPELQSTAWFGIFAPARTPTAIVDRLAGEIRRVVASTEYQEKFISGFSLEAPGETPQQFASLLRTDFERYARDVKAAGIAAD
jgi:tripartite-type tricarboxylate transporter receptor subunit TctC